MIDYVIMRADQLVLCVDVQVMRGANCWSDHSMVRAKVRFWLPHLKKVHQAPCHWLYIHYEEYRITNPTNSVYKHV